MGSIGGLAENRHVEMLADSQKKKCEFYMAQPIVFPGDPVAHNVSDNGRRGLYTFQDLVQLVQVSLLTPSIPSLLKWLLISKWLGSSLEVTQFDDSLRSSCHASPQEIRAGLKAMGAVEVQGFWRRVDAEYLGDLLERIIYRCLDNS
eukprot:1152821-Pelagomonas_calceolata.AAC.2